MECGTLPARLDKILGDVGVGAALRNLENGERALIIDFVPVSGMPMIVVARPLQEDELPSTLRDYEIVGPLRDEDLHEWLVLTEGHDELLLE